MNKEECHYCRKNHYNNDSKINIIEQTFNDGSRLTVNIIEGTLHSHLDLSKKTSNGNKKFDYSKCQKINYCPMCGRKLKEVSNE